MYKPTHTYYMGIDHVFFQTPAYVDIHQNFDWIGNGVILEKEVLCPPRYKPEAYVHIYQDFQSLTMFSSL